jgi:hypothetical protein
MHDKVHIGSSTLTACLVLASLYSESVLRRLQCGESIIGRHLGSGGIEGQGWFIRTRRILGRTVEPTRFRGEVFHGRGRRE